MELCQLEQPRLRNFRHAHMRRRCSTLPLDVCLRQNPEQRRLPNLWQSNNPCLHARPFPLLISRSVKLRSLAHTSLLSVVGGFPIAAFIFVTEWTHTAEIGLRLEAPTPFG
jgi:hypothetical protein